MGLEDLKCERPTEDKLYDPAFLEPIPAHLDQQPPPRPGDPQYTHSIFYDETRFSSEADQNVLLQRVRNRFPANLEWVLSPTTVGRLPIEMRFYGANHTKQFERNGFIAELERPRFNSGRTHARSVLSQKAWDAFCANAVMVEALADACEKMRDRRAENVIFADLKVDALASILGKVDKADEDDEADETQGTNLLACHQGLLVAPRTFTIACTAYPADPVTCKSAVTLGRSVLGSWTSDERRAIRRRMEAEIQVWSDQLGPDFSADGLMLRATQPLGLLRIQATEWRFRERLRYIISGEPEFADDERARPTKDAYVSEEIAMIRDQLNPRNDSFIVQRPNCTTEDHIRSLLAGGIGLPPEISHDEEPYYDAEMYSQNQLHWLATWVSGLRRFHTARLTGPLTGLIQEIVTEQFDEISPYDCAVARLIRAEFPLAVWNGLLAAAQDCPHGTEWIEVRYVWNEDPTAVSTTERDGDAIVILGSLLNTNAASQRWWAQRAEQFRKHRSLVIK